jgi:hypothetical protein
MATASRLSIRLVSQVGARWSPARRLMLTRALALLAALAAAALSAPGLRWLIEQSMVWHTLIQMPLLVLAGWLAHAAFDKASDTPFGKALDASGQPTASAPRADWFGAINRYGLTGFMLAQLIALYWMIPSSIDRAVVLPSVDLVKLVTLWICGLALRDAMRRSPAPVQIFFVGYTLPMMLWLGLYLATTEIRLCNAYPLDTQIEAGRGMMGLSAALGLLWLGSLGLRRVFTGA